MSFSHLLRTRNCDEIEQTRIGYSSCRQRNEYFGQCLHWLSRAVERTQTIKRTKLEWRQTTHENAGRTKQFVFEACTIFHFRTLSKCGDSYCTHILAFMDFLLFAWCFYAFSPTQTISFTLRLYSHGCRLVTRRSVNSFRWAWSSHVNEGVFHGFAPQIHCLYGYIITHSIHYLKEKLDNSIAHFVFVCSVFISRVISSVLFYLCIGFYRFDRC